MGEPNTSQEAKSLDLAESDLAGMLNLPAKESKPEVKDNKPDPLDPDIPFKPSEEDEQFLKSVGKEEPAKEPEKEPEKRPEPQKKAEEPEPKKEPDEKGKDKSPRPVFRKWDPNRQKLDQEKANVAKKQAAIEVQQEQINTLTGLVKELVTNLAKPASQATKEAAEDVAEEIENTLGSLTSESDATDVAKAIRGLPKALRKLQSGGHSSELRQQVQALQDKLAETSNRLEAIQAQSLNQQLNYAEEKAAEFWDRYLNWCDETYGSQHRADALKAMQHHFAEAGFDSENNKPSDEAIVAQTELEYLRLSQKTPKGGEKPGKKTVTLDTGQGGGAVPSITPGGVEDVIEDMKRQGRFKGMGRRV